MRIRFVLISLAFSASVSAQGTREDYDRADALPGRFRGLMPRETFRAIWIDDDRFWHRDEGPEGTWRFAIVEARTGEPRPAFDHEALAKALAERAKQLCDPERLPFDQIVVEPDGAVLCRAFDRWWRFSTETGEISEAEPPTPPDRKARRPGRPGLGRRLMSTLVRGLSPDGRYRIVAENHHLVLHSVGSEERHVLTKGGTADDGYDGHVVWSPDSTRFVAMRVEAGQKRDVFVVESSPRDQLQPKLLSYGYLKPGDRVRVEKPHLFDVETKREIPVSDELFPNPWSLDDLRWDEDSSRFTFFYNQRGHQATRVVAVDAKTGEARAIIEETSPTFIDYSQKMFRHDLPESGEILWASERSGWNHLYLVDAMTGEVKNAVTSGEWLVREVVRVDEERRQVLFRAMGIRPGQDPYHVHYAKVNFDGTGLVVLTEGDGTHSAEFSTEGTWMIDTYSRVDLPPVVELRSGEDGRLVRELDRADASALREAGWRAPERFSANGRDGSTEIYGVIYRPSGFDPGRKYPVIERIYAGPQSAFVPKGFSPFHPGQELAELGFLVVQIDGMGTNWRSKAFHDVCWKDLKDAGFPDRIAWLKAAAEHEPAMDLSRVGLYGGSAGGQNALGGLLFHGDFYKVAVADCGCHDNRMDKIWWNEAWMGWPIGPQYEASSNVVNARRLRGKLLLTVGEVDHNVDPASTMQVVDALIRAGKEFDLVVFPGKDHGAGSSPYGQRRMRDFFVRHLLGVAPPDWNAAE